VESAFVQFNPNDDRGFLMEIIKRHCLLPWQLRFSLFWIRYYGRSAAKRNMTVHEKWLNTGILSGDAMLILAYQYFEQYEPAVLYDWQN
jgi:hypothetical protein